MIEREVKIRVADPASLEPALRALGAVRVGVEQEINRILDTQDGTLRRGRQVLRVRSADQATLTWKGPAAESDPRGHKTREELEVTVASDGVDTLLSLLQRLGYTEMLHYDKRRETWRWQGLAIALDHLDFGNFVELEGEAGAIEHALQALGLKDQPFEERSYPELQRLAQQTREGR